MVIVYWEGQKDHLLVVCRLNRGTSAIARGGILSISTSGNTYLLIYTFENTSLRIREIYFQESKKYRLNRDNLWQLGGDTLFPSQPIYTLLQLETNSHFKIWCTILSPTTSLPTVTSGRTKITQSSHSPTLIPSIYLFFALNTIDNLSQYSTLTHTNNQ